MKCARNLRYLATSYDLHPQENLLNFTIKSSSIPNPYNPSVNHSFQTDLYNCLLQALKAVASLLELKQIHNLTIRNGFLSKSVLACRLICNYSCFSGLAEARKLFDHLPRQSVYAYNYILQAYIDHKQYEFALPLYSRMLSLQIFPLPTTMSLIIKACCELRSTNYGKFLHAHVVTSGFGCDIYLITALVDLYSKCNCLSFARQLFDKMPQRDVILWTSMICGYLQTGDYPEALRLFSEMRETGSKANLVTWNALIGGFVRGGFLETALLKFNQMQLDCIQPDKVSLCTILPAISRFAILKLGREVHGYVIRMGFELDLFVISGLVDMYAKCGHLAFARYLFDQVKVRDTGLWNALLVGYGIHGHCEEALQLFHRMRTSDVRPNEITFTSVISACSHAGMVDEGLKCFDYMIHDVGIVPCSEHYACMVDLLGRAGRLEEAHRFIKSMPTEPSKDVWGAFLSACRIYHNVDLAEIAAKHIIHIEAIKDAGYHVMMSNIYAETGRWDNVAKLRSSIRKRGLKKLTGFSWIEIEGRVNIFYTADTSHPETEQIRSVLTSFELIDCWI